MTSDHTPFTLLRAALQARGFDYRRRRADGSWEFHGALHAAEGDHPAVVSVDPKGLKLPLVSVCLPPNAPKVLAHIGAGGQVCYAAKGSVVPDVFDIAGQTVAHLQRAAEVLDLSLRGKMKKDLEDEFFAFWHGTPCFVDVERDGPSELTVIFASYAADRTSMLFVGNQPAGTRLKLQAMGLEEGPDTGAVAVKVQSSANPRPLIDDWPPKTMAALLAWQGMLDPAARRNMERKLLVACGKGRQAALCVVAAPVTQYAIFVSFPDPGPKEARPTESLRKRLYASEVQPMSLFRFDDAYVSQRNTPQQPTLAHKRIVLVGCGTIGGFLAELLVKNGAGLGRGELLLVDPDILAPQNVGRHRLGMNYVLKNKATALAHELRRGAPTANLRDLPVAVEQGELGRADLFINATGEEALAHLLTREWTKQQLFIPTLTVWVEGAGVAARALFRDAPEQACTRCMSDLQRKPLFPAVTEPIPVELAGHGCESLYVPFPATASVHAACLAAEMVVDWNRGVPSPRLRTRVIRSSFSPASGDVDVSRLPQCPACSS
ncbi:MAG: ThiF family adenylyltransferase [Polaromonas sp.]|uniref:ThiF family adenylyltransferase n=1 Tax=Polaromonas sp. TaxID=1869339 RepID=UPI0025E7CB16|nr:ThiF family adenylyltransferase [Polaromonas sp.]MBI2726196.1 ThiF family adenylyltransferase [Polaromonas sp.]